MHTERRGTAMQAAIANGSTECLRVLLAAGGDPNVGTRCQRFSALQHAAFRASSHYAGPTQPRLRVTEMLLSAGANPDAEANDTDDFLDCTNKLVGEIRNPLQAAVTCHLPRVVVLLCIFGARFVGRVSAWIKRASLSHWIDAWQHTKDTLMECLQRTPFMTALVESQRRLGMAALAVGVCDHDPALHRVRASTIPNEKVRACVRACVPSFFAVCVHCVWFVCVCVLLARCVLLAQCVQVPVVEHECDGTMPVCWRSNCSVTVSARNAVSGRNASGFVARARKPWCTPNHFTFSKRFGNVALTTLLVAIRMENADGHTLHVPTEMWQLICSFVLRSSYRRLD